MVMTVKVNHTRSGEKSKTAQQRATFPVTGAVQIELCAADLHVGHFGAHINYKRKNRVLGLCIWVYVTFFATNLFHVVVHKSKSVIVRF
jgi:hypothetical protein